MKRSLRLALGLCTTALLHAAAPASAELATRERLTTAPVVSGALWTVVLPLLVLVVSFVAAFALYRHFSSE